MMEKENYPGKNKEKFTLSLSKASFHPPGTNQWTRKTIDEFIEHVDKEVETSKKGAIVIFPHCTYKFTKWMTYKRWRGFWIPCKNPFKKKKCQR